MKTIKTYLIIAITCLAINANAQLKVRTDGSIHTGYNGYANIFMGTYNWQGTDNGKWGFEIWGDNLNIWKPWPSASNGDCNYYMFFTPSGAIGVGQAPTHSGICLDVNGKVYAGGIELTSDERLKTDIKPLTDRLDKLYQLNGKSYKKHAVPDEVTLPDIKDEKGNIIKKYEKTKNRASKETSEFGFLAQELKEAYPELVSQDTLGYYYVNYIGLIPVLVEALKDQHNTITAQSVKIKELAERLSAIENNPILDPKGNTKSTKVTTDTPTTDNVTNAFLYQNAPNPFTVNTEIKYYLPESIISATLFIYDMQGLQIKSIPIQQHGNASITLHGSEFKAGMYIYTLIADGKEVDTKRMILTN